MKRILGLLVLVLVFALILGTRTIAGMDSENSTEFPDSGNLVIESSETCPVYEAKGEITYNSEWTGEYPAVDQVTTDYRTATFGLG